MGSKDGESAPDEDLADRVARCVLDAYQNRLAGTARVADDEWTIAAGIVISLPGRMRCVAVAAGLKCLGSGSVLRSGELVVDCHAEILARRAFRLWLMSRIAVADAGDLDDVIVVSQTESGSEVSINSSARFHFFTSELPCGDASMEYLDRSQTAERREVNERKRRDHAARMDDLNEQPSDINVVRGRMDYSRLGVLRTKPGRPDADASASMSCSDKIARWNVVGIAGRELSDLIGLPVYLATIVVGGRLGRPSDSDVDLNALKRAVVGRLSGLTVALPPPYRLNRPHILFSSLTFPWSRSPGRTRTSPLSAFWWDGCQKAEVLVEGRLRGSKAPREGRLEMKAASSVSRVALRKRFSDLAGILSRSPAGDSGSEYAAADKALKLGSFVGWVGNQWASM
ncbi:hypothetical protein DFJ74DRAFT_607403 [Hyaloraphidium curvatum]|nr:hypothetical protein DFJ74DRAFT_607403 [Hyaloraphidium curvatum]